MNKQDSGEHTPSLPGSSDSHFRYHLHDTIILLGGKKEIAAMLARSGRELPLSEADVSALRNYNITLLEQTKSRLDNINTLNVRNAGQ